MVDAAHVFDGTLREPRTSGPKAFLGQETQTLIFVNIFNVLGWLFAHSKLLPEIGVCPSQGGKEVPLELFFWVPEGNTVPQNRKMKRTPSAWTSPFLKQILVGGCIQLMIVTLFGCVRSMLSKPPPSGNYNQSCLVS